jgi:hypothetical protein
MIIKNKIRIYLVFEMLTKIKTLLTKCKQTFLKQDKLLLAFSK